MARPSIAVHKFSSCDGCQLAFLNAGEDLLKLAQLVDIRHFLEAGVADEYAMVDIAFVEGSISTTDELTRIQRVRANSRFVVTLGACATSGGLQALRNLDDSNEAWKHAIYARPEFIQTLDRAEPVSDHIQVDFEIWGCPVNGATGPGRGAAAAVRRSPLDQRDKVCMECKRQHAVCVMVTEGRPCLGPVTRTGCGALCPRFGRDCYACFGPAENINADAMAIAGSGSACRRPISRAVSCSSTAMHRHSARPRKKHYQRGFGDD